MKKFPKAVFFAAFFCLFTYTSSFAVGLEEMAKFGVGVRPLGMGGAFTAVADDVNSIYYNPAGLGDLNFGYSLGNQDLNREQYLFSSYNMLNIGFAGFSQWRVRSVSGESADISTFAMGRMSNAGLSFGASYKNIRYMSSLESISSWSGDVGLLLRLTPDLTVGLVGQDVLKGQEIDIPSTARMGVAYHPFSKLLIMAFDIETGRSGDLGVLTNYGFEAGVTDGFKLRAGSNRGAGCFGASLSFPLFDVHYAYLSQNRPKSADAIHTLSFEISAPKERKRPLSFTGPKEFALIDVRGPLVGGRDKFSLFGGAKSGADNILSQIRRAAKDKAVSGILLRISGLDNDLGSDALVQEIRSELKRAKDAGKKIVAYIETSAIGDEYYLASASDAIVAPSGSSIGGLGKALTVTRISGLMKNLGIDWQILAKGKYKESFNSYGKTMTADQKEMISSMVSDLYRGMLTDIAADRKIDIAKLKEIGDGRLFTASEAKDLKLIDKIGYFKDASVYAAELVKGDKDEDVRMIDAKDLFVEEDDYLFYWPNKIAVIEVDGEIVTGKSGSNLIFGGNVVGSDTVCERIKKAYDDFMVRAIILRVNSPGGSPIGSGQIYQELLKAKEKGKVVIASFGDIAASGGYLIAAASDKIVADPASITGSIGVIWMMPVITELYKKIGVTVDVVKEGSHADMFSGLRKLSSEEVASINNLMEESYVEFKNVVAKGRGMTTEEVERLAQGKVYTGSQALSVKLVDKLGGFSDAVDLARDLARISGEPKLVFYREDDLFMGNILELTERLGLKEGILPSLKTGLAEYRLLY